MSQQQQQTSDASTLVDVPLVDEVQTQNQGEGGEPQEVQETPTSRAIAGGKSLYSSLSSLLGNAGYKWVLLISWVIATVALIALPDWIFDVTMVISLLCIPLVYTSTNK